jgi:hypothetical protein
MKHILDEIIEKYILYPESFDKEEKTEILDHLNDCAICSNVYEKLLSIYNAYPDFNNITSDHNDELVANRIFFNKQHPKLQLPVPKIVKSEIKFLDFLLKPIKSNNYISTIRKFIKAYPISSLSISIFIFVLLFYSTSLIFKKFTVDNKPYSIIKENFLLKVYNKNGDFLWKLNIYGFPDLPLDSLLTFDWKRRKLINFEDIDNDGYKELLITGFSDNPNNDFVNDTLYCFNFDGTLRWKTPPESKEFNYTPDWRKTKWQIAEFFHVKTKNGEKVFVYANDAIYAGTIFSLIDPKEGKITSSLYIAGHTLKVLKIDLDKDGFDEIITGGYSTYFLPRIAVLNTEKFYGVSPDYYTENLNLPKANLPYFILLPITEFARNNSNLKHLAVIDVKKNQTFNGFSVITREYAPENSDYPIGNLVFAFDSNMICKHISPTTFYNENYNIFYKQGLVSKPLDKNYLEELKNEILYWDGDKFVNSPVKNKYSLNF